MNKHTRSIIFAFAWFFSFAGVATAQSFTLSDIQNIMTATDTPVFSNISINTDNPYASVLTDQAVLDLQYQTNGVSQKVTVDVSASEAYAWQDLTFSIDVDVISSNVPLMQASVTEAVGGEVTDNRTFTGDASAVDLISSITTTDATASILYRVGISSPFTQRGARTFTVTYSLIAGGV